MTRYVIFDGDHTTVAGLVQAKATSFALSGRQIAHEDDIVFCPMCRTIGRIQCDGPRLPVTGPDGRRVALSDDLCICKCSTPPRLVASQKVTSVIV
ncbi:PAAR domain-containing protein [Burkholderia stagnalis]|uniref:PAAR domain-containing protein n=1 Tax=Burkholderia stagnalis TaxID=1503054 RepID=UPI000F5651C5|nr:PAAR domain-containing protein [Burkholderia stagnalis]RQQ30903.1 PAAR domain-containing protein [Burkholderia stagnalis]RQQ33289.1 PAAR domain-containing protein [Burkholderia stagnalis]RQQ48348.1 PAAR domain-containing protein [Burkholderia stagnalis]RQY07144.1 PAAR domain-containing protein [Burkholderia stagnalis]RQY48967.1 PAAR domain-containing protein [Burkholderia stagnalis]